MKTEELNRLLEKYYKGESTEEEEEVLRAFFNKDETPEGCEAEKAIFSYYQSVSSVPEPSSDLEAKILKGIDESENRRQPAKFRKYMLPYLSAAAGILLILASWFFVHRNEPKDTFRDPELAYAATLKILFAVSSQLNQGIDALAPVAKMNEMTAKSFEQINSSTRIVKENLKKLGYIQKPVKDTKDTVSK